ncbi:transcription repressor OFP13-like [Oryza brachyantha]|uniref:transcription repressor OFP13-like n=1 Tax=Oryza brachyantha TaxID=4533 RepID=UPI001ADC32A9|nr:transcription repressor OFP13-like [Oryza brachyantha]
MPPLNPPHLHFHRLRKRTRAAAGGCGGGGHHHQAPAAAAMAKKGLAGILYKLRDVHHRPQPPQSVSPTSPSPSPHCHGRHRLCYPPAPSSWPWPSCRHPRTSSFRWPALGQEDDASVYRTVNTVYDTSSEHFNQRRSSLDEASPCIVDRSFLAVEPAAAEEEEEKELQLRETAVVRGVRSERLFFEPAGAEFLPKQEMARGKNDEATAMDIAPENDDVDEATTTTAGKNEAAIATEAAVLKGGAVVLTVESEDPYGDFRSSMADMVAAHGLRDWEGLEELLAWYLKLNGKGVHGVIVGAFIDLLVSLASSPSPSLPSPSPSSSCITFEDYSSATMEESCS